MAQVRAHTVHHLDIDIACSPAAAWSYTIANMAEGGMFAVPGCTVEPIGTDLSAPIGGYRFRIQTAESVDERICRVTERDEEVLRLSLHTEAISAAGRNMVIYVTYHVAPSDAGCRYQVDSHSSLDLDISDEASPAEIASAIAALRTQFDDGLQASLIGIKAQMEQRL